MIASAGGQTYLIPQPQQQPMQAQRAPQAPEQEQSPWDIPMPKDELANVENLTSNYYNAYGTLKDYTTTMWKDYGVDVTKPDFAQPGGGDLHQAFLSMDAELRMAANDLVEQRKRTEEMAKMEAQGKVVRGTYVDPATGKTVVYDPSKMLERQFVTPEGQKVSPYVATGLEDAALKAIDRGSQTYYTKPDADAANQEIANVIEMYDEKMKADPYNREYYQRQKDAIMLATKKTPGTAFNDRTRERAAELQTTIDMAKKVVKDSTGYGWTPDRIKYRYVNNQTVPVIVPEQQTSHGEIQVETTDKSGKKEVKTIKKVVDFYYLNPTDGSVTARYTAGPQYDTRTDDKLASELVNQFYENNRDYGKAATAAKAMSDYSTSQTGGVTVSDFLPPEDIQSGQILKEQAVQTARQIETKVQAEKQRLLGDVKTAGAKAFGGEFTVPIGGKEIKFSGQWFGGLIDLEGGVDTYKKLKNGQQPPSSIALTDMDEDQFIKLMEDLGYFDEFIQKEAPTSTSTSVSGGKTITQAQFDQSVKEAGLTSPNEIAIYRKELEDSGYTIK